MTVETAIMIKAVVVVLMVRMVLVAVIMAYHWSSQSW